MILNCIPLAQRRQRVAAGRSSSGRGHGSGCGGGGTRLGARAVTGGMADAPEPGQCDAVLLAPLTEDTFLHNLHVRYKQDVIYVSAFT